MLRERWLADLRQESAARRVHGDTRAPFGWTACPRPRIWRSSGPASAASRPIEARSSTCTSVRCRLVAPTRSDTSSARHWAGAVTPRRAATRPRSRLGGRQDHRRLWLAGRRVPRVAQRDDVPARRAGGIRRDGLVALLCRPRSRVADPDPEPDPARLGLPVLCPQASRQLGGPGDHPPRHCRPVGTRPGTRRPRPISPTARITRPGGNARYTSRTSGAPGSRAVRRCSPAARCAIVSRTHLATSARTPRTTPSHSACPPLIGIERVCLHLPREARRRAA